MKVAFGELIVILIFSTTWHTNTLRMSSGSIRSQRSVAGMIRVARLGPGRRSWGVDVRDGWDGLKVGSCAGVRVRPEDCIVCGFFERCLVSRLVGVARDNASAWIAAGGTTSRPSLGGVLCLVAGGGFRYERECWRAAMGDRVDTLLSLPFLSYG